MVSFIKPTFAVLGLGRFGIAVARELMAEGSNVVGVDINEAIVDRNNGLLTQVIRADSTDLESLKAMGIEDFTGVVVGIGGSHVEQSILTCSLLKDLGVANLWAKSSGTAHDRILQQIGVPHIVYPEVAMGRRVAHLLRDQTLDYVELSDGTAVVRTTVPAKYAGPLDEERLWRSHKVKIIAWLDDGVWQPILPGSELHGGEDVQVYGATQAVESFARDQRR